MLKDFEVSNINLLEDYSNAFGDGFKKFKDKFKVGGKAQIDFNCAINKIPLAVPRAGVLAGARLNIFGMSTRLYPALISEEEAKRRHFNLENRKKAIKGWENAKKIWYNVGGCSELYHLEKAIKSGYDKPVFKTKKVKERQSRENGFDGEYSNADAGVSEALIIGGVTIITSIVGAIAKSGASKNPYDDRKIDTSGMDEPTLTPEQRNQLDELTKEKPVEEKKFLGMPQTTGIIVTSLVGVALIIGAVVIYKKVNS